jgi:hypothetical protein
MTRREWEIQHPLPRYRRRTFAEGKAERMERRMSERPDHIELPDDVTVLDLAQAEAMFRAWRRGKMTKAALRYRLITDCGVPDHMVDEGIEAFGKLSMADIEAMEKDDEIALLALARRRRSPN